MAAKIRNGDRNERTGTPDAVLVELVKFLARRAAERDDAASRIKTDRTARTGGRKRDSE